MFERYTEKARRVIFIAREEASEFGREAIEADFILLGVARENPELCHQWLRVYYADLREKIEPMYRTKKQIPTSVDLPLSSASKRVLAYADEEAGRLGDRGIDCEHLFLGLLREGGTTAKLLKAQRKDVKDVRTALAQDPTRTELKSASPHGLVGLQIGLVDEGGAGVAVIPWQGRTPRIGESIGIPIPEVGEANYRILDLCWRMDNIPVLQPFEILMKVRKEPT